MAYIEVGLLCYLVKNLHPFLGNNASKLTRSIKSRKPVLSNQGTVQICFHHEFKRTQGALYA